MYTRDDELKRSKFIIYIYIKYVQKPCQKPALSRRRRDVGVARGVASTKSGRDPFENRHVRIPLAVFISDLSVYRENTHADTKTQKGILQRRSNGMKLLFSNTTIAV